MTELTSRRDLTGTPPDGGDSNPSPDAWALLRVDDNGNRFLMGRFASCAEAQARRYEARGHKQVYFIEAAADGPPPESRDLPVPLSAPRCPLCGEENDCAVSRSGSFDTPCWCRNVVISAQALSRVPAAQRHRACLCPRCAGVLAETDKQA